MVEFSDRLKYLQQKHKLLKKDIAAAIGISTVMYYYYETNHSIPSTDVIIKLSRFFNCSTDFLLGVSNSQTINDPVLNDSDILEAAI